MSPGPPHMLTRQRRMSKVKETQVCVLAFLWGREDNRYNPKNPFLFNKEVNISWN